MQYLTSLYDDDLFEDVLADHQASISIRFSPLASLWTVLLANPGGRCSAQSSVLYVAIDEAIEIAISEGWW